MIARPALSLALVCGLFLTESHGQPGARKTEADILAGKRLSNPAQREQAVREIGDMMAERRKLARARAVQLGMPTRTVRKDGTVVEVVDIDDISGQPVYLITHNANAAISTGADIMRTSGALSGDGVTAGVWDGGVARANHQEFQGERASAKDGGTVIDHATHVAGTMIASGVQPSARGMAVSGRVDSYDWNSALAEMVSRAATYANEPDKIPLSNHSYGFVRGWNWNGSQYVWGGFAGNTASSIEANFGLYSSTTRSVDVIAHDAPYYLMFWSAGNERNNNPSTGSSVSVGRVTVAYDPALHPPGDGVYRGGYDTLADYSVAKNVITIGAANDAVTGGLRDTSKATLSTFTSWGPTDDGRIKPDVVANGVSVYSPVAGSSSAYASYSGTSMSTPNATGTAMLLVDHYDNLFPGQAMLASTLKGLLIHTADDRGRPGPDYQYGWGMIDGVEAMETITQHHADPTLLRITEGVLNETSPSPVHEFVWDGVSPIKVTICWTDPEGISGYTSDSRTRNLVNDLNIKLVGPGDSEHFPFVMPFVGTWTQASMSANATTGVNTTDNVEQVVVNSPPLAGNYRVVITHDGPLTGGQQQYSLLVSGSETLNTPPSISAIADIVTAEDSGEIVANFTVSDAQSDSGEVTVSAESDNPELTGEISVVGEGGNKTLSFQTAEHAFGQATVTVSASDGELETSTTFTVQVFAVNDPPSMVAPPDIQVDGGSDTLSVGITIYDPDHDETEITLLATSDNQDLLPDGNIVLGGSGQNRTVAVSPLPGRYGRATVTVTATDGELSSSAAFAVTAPNPHPIFGAWIEGWGIEGDRGEAGDPDGDGIPNAAEYFYGLNPFAHSNEIVAAQQIAGEGVIFDYRRSRTINGISGVVKWSTSPDAGSDWTSAGVQDFPISVDPGFDWRRAVIPWPEGHQTIFIRLDLSIDP